MGDSRQGFDSRPAGQLVAFGMSNDQERPLPGNGRSSFRCGGAAIDASYRVTACFPLAKFDITPHELTLVIRNHRFAVKRDDVEQVLVYRWPFPTVVVRQRGFPAVLCCSILRGVGRIESSLTRCGYSFGRRRFLWILPQRHPG